MRYCGFQGIKQFARRICSTRTNVPGADQPGIVHPMNALQELPNKRLACLRVSYSRKIPSLSTEAQQPRLELLCKCAIPRPHWLTSSTDCVIQLRMARITSVVTPK